MEPTRSSPSPDGQPIPPDQASCPRSTPTGRWWTASRENVLLLVFPLLLVLFVVTGIAARSYHAKERSLAVEWHLRGEADLRAGRARVGPNRPVAISVHLASPEPLEPQIAQLLSARLSARLASPVELHGEVVLEDPGYSPVVEKPDVRRGLSFSERQALKKLLELVEKRDDLRARITFALAKENPQDASASLFAAAGGSRSVA